ncbi:TIGR04222 domain-containing membrane protein [Streptomyces sp. NPDC060194]|uniref:TIGR04222 domain-containing membrane protein n=1 Tax=Streptomyces sp. NPDC060194 TaxID=3347069 RepID=UPI0036599DE4
MGWSSRRFGRGAGSDTGPGGTPAPDVYDVAFLAGGAPRVADSAIVALQRRGLLAVHASRACTVAGWERPEHPVERAAVDFCGRSRGLAAVRLALTRSPEVDEIGRRLAARGLVAGARRRVTRRGRRCLRAAGLDAGVPAYVLEGAAILPDGTVRRPAEPAPALPSGLGRTLRRMGKALDGESDASADTGAACGGGSGGGGGGGD